MTRSLRLEFPGAIRSSDELRQYTPESIFYERRKRGILRWKCISAGFPLTRKRSTIVSRQDGKAGVRLLISFVALDPAQGK
jgi:hypothetical protein